MATTNAAGFDLQLFRKLLALFDSNRAGEVDAAVHRAVEMCARHKVRFGDAVAEACLDESRIAELEAETAALQERVEQREADGAKLATALEQARATIAKLQETIADLRKRRSRGTGNLCWDCERKLRALATVTSTVIGIEWYRWLPWAKAEIWQNECGIALAAAPITAILCRWRWLMFKKKYLWNGPRDNDIYRGFVKKWNQFLGRFFLQ